MNAAIIIYHNVTMICIVWTEPINRRMTVVKKNKKKSL